MMKLEMMFFGGLQLSQDGTSLVDFSSEKGKALLCYLAVTGQPHSRASLAGLLWPESLEANARASLRKVLTEIRTKAPPCLNSTRQTVAIDPDASTWVDVIQFERSVTVAADVDGLQEAVALYQGDFLERFLLPDAPAFDQWALRQRARLRQMAVEALHTLATHFAERQDYDTAVSYARQLLDIEPWHEETHRELMRLLALSGQRSAALAQYELCRRLLADELGIEPAAATVQLYEQIKGEEWSGEAESPPLPHSSAPPHNLPPQMTPFVGRESELAQLQQLLAAPDIHLITILGPGGMGKTRLALALAASQLHGQQQPYPFRHGVYFASLARLETADLLVSAIAGAINFRFAEGDDLQGQLLRYLAAKAMLLVFDNFEHLLAGTGLVDAILHAAPQVKIVITSRARLNRQVEQLFLIGGMAYPQVNGATNGDSPLELNHYSAVQLFVQCARRVRPDFGLTAANQPHILKICQLLQGMPLGLALAASWLESLSPRAISREVQQDIDFLVTDMGDVPRRQRSLRAAFNHSWRLLSTRGREIFCQMSIFRGGSTRAAAQAVTGATLRDLQALVNKSLLTLTADRRYDVHELLRQYGAEKLAEDGEREISTQQKYARYYCNTLQQWEDDIKSTRMLTTLHEIEADFENIRLAIHWATKHEQVASINMALESLCWFYVSRQRLLDGDAMCEFLSQNLAAYSASLPFTDSIHRLLLRTLIWRASFNLSLDRKEVASRLLDQSSVILNNLTSARQEVRLEKARLLLVRGNLLKESKAYNETRLLLEESLGLYDIEADKWGMCEAYFGLGEVSFYANKLDEATEWFEKALALAQTNGYNLWELEALTWLGHVVVQSLNYEKAEQLYKKCLVMTQAQGNLIWEEEILVDLGWLAFSQGKYETSVQYFQKSLTISQELGVKFRVGFRFGDLGRSLFAAGQFDQAQAMFQESLSIHQDLDLFQYLAGSKIWLATVKVHTNDLEGTESLIRSGLAGGQRSGDYWVIGKAYSLLSMVDLARRQPEMVVQKLPKSIAALTRIPDKEPLLLSMGISGLAAFHLGQQKEARQKLYEALRIAVDTHEFFPLLYIVSIIALLLVDDKPKLGIELYTFAAEQPHIANSKWFEIVVGRQMKKIINDLPQDIAILAKVSGKEQDWWPTAESLLSELQALDWNERRPTQP